MAKEEKTQSTPDVKVMGERVDQSYFHGVDFGTFLIFSGIILLLNTFEIVSWEFWDSLWKFWPLLLVLMGLQIIFSKGPLLRLILTILSIFVVGNAFMLALREVSPDLVSKMPDSILQLITIWDNLGIRL